MKSFKYIVCLSLLSLTITPSFRVKTSLQAQMKTVTEATPEQVEEILSAAIELAKEPDNLSRLKEASKEANGHLSLIQDKVFPVLNSILSPVLSGKGFKNMPIEEFVGKIHLTRDVPVQTNTKAMQRIEEIAKIATGDLSSLEAATDTQLTSVSKVDGVNVTSSLLHVSASNPDENFWMEWVTRQLDAMPQNTIKGIVWSKTFQADIYDFLVNTNFIERILSDDVLLTKALAGRKGIANIEEANWGRLPMPGVLIGQTAFYVQRVHCDAHCKEIMMLTGKLRKAEHTTWTGGMAKSLVDMKHLLTKDGGALIKFLLSQMAMLPVVQSAMTRERLLVAFSAAQPQMVIYPEPLWNPAVTVKATDVIVGPVDPPKNPRREIYNKSEYNEVQRVMLKAADYVNPFTIVPLLWKARKFHTKGPNNPDEVSAMVDEMHSRFPALISGAMSDVMVAFMDVILKGVENYPEFVDCLNAAAFGLKFKLQAEGAGQVGTAISDLRFEEASEVWERVRTDALATLP